MKTGERYARFFYESTWAMYIFCYMYIMTTHFLILPGVMIPVLTHWQYSRERIVEGIICDDIGP